MFDTRGKDFHDLEATIVLNERRPIFVKFYDVGSVCTLLAIFVYCWLIEGIRYMSLV